MNRTERILSNRSLKNRKSLSKSRPSANFMQEGEEVFYINKDRRRRPILNLYRKQSGRLWRSRFFDESFKDKDTGGGGPPTDFGEPMRTSFNSIGIGSQEVPSKLTVTDTKDTVFSNRVKASDFDILLKNKTNRVNAFSGIAFDSAKGSERNGVGACIAGLSDNTATDLHDTNLIFATNDGNVDGLTERVRITHDGNVGIGTESPSANADLTLEDGVLNLKETTTPTADENYAKIYAKADNRLYWQDGAGNEHTITHS
jgi:hypothetical protein